MINYMCLNAKSTISYLPTAHANLGFRAWPILSISTIYLTNYRQNGHNRFYRSQMPAAWHLLGYKNNNKDTENF